MDQPSPHTEYTQRLEDRRRRAESLHRVHMRYGNIRLGIVIAAALMAWLAFGYDLFSPGWLLAPGVLFLCVAVLHERVLRRRNRARRSVRFYERGLARLEDRWAGTGEAGNRFASDAHLYSPDLDLFGKGSLFELLSTTRTRAGEEELARWLAAPASVETIRLRHQAIEELRDLTGLREELALLGGDVHSGVNARALATWSLKPRMLDSKPLRVAAAGLPVLAVMAAIVWARYGLPSPFLAVLALEAGVAVALRRTVLRVVHQLDHPARDLDLLAGILRLIESQQFRSERLRQLRAMFDTDGHPPSRVIRRLDLLTDLVDSRDNVLVRLIGPPLMWTTQVAFAVEAWRHRNGASVRRWLDGIAEIGALVSLAAYSYEHPGDPFPEFAESGEPIFEAEGLGHPLLPEARFIRNDVRLGGELRALVVSGSNMSGKSTLLRTIGVNVVLAMAGAPVRARRLRLSPLRLGACIRITDSLQGGTSRFYAEITRLRNILDLSGQESPLLVLLDELLNGTNSHDRRAGAEAVVRELIERGAIGVVTTHDLALTQIAESVAPRASNVHFEDRIENGKISFDYRLHPGIVTTSNALELMRSVGLRV